MKKQNKTTAAFFKETIITDNFYIAPRFVLYKLTVFELGELHTLDDISQGWYWVCCHLHCTPMVLKAVLK